MLCVFDDKGVIKNLLCSLKELAAGVIALVSNSPINRLATMELMGGPIAAYGPVQNAQLGRCNMCF